MPDHLASLDLSGIAAIIGLFIGQGVIRDLISAWWTSRKIKKTEAKILEGQHALKLATIANFNTIIANQLLGAIAGRDPATYHTLGITFITGENLAIPVIPGDARMVLENITVNFLSHSSEGTYLALVCNGFGHISDHYHRDHTEEIEVKRGLITCLKTGHQYRAGDIWTIQPGESHAATFQNCLAIMKYLPPLPTADIQPVDLEAMIQK